MSKMIPSNIGEEEAKKSHAEAMVFGWLKEMTWGNATVLYSLPLKEHIRNSFGEIDFVVICDEGILCIEVKGGTVERRDGQWGYTNRYGNTTWKSQGPYIQAQGNMKSLRQYLEKHLKIDDPILDCRMACCVITPDCIITADDDTEIIPDISFNASMKPSDLPKVFERCFKYWSEKKRYAGKGGLNSKSKDRLVSFLRGDFSFVPALSVLLDRSEEQLLSITSEQYQIIERMCINDRMMIEGGAGTGKTVLATEQCRKSAIVGEKVLYLCFNHAIASFIREVFSSESDKPDIDVYTFHELLMKLCGEKYVGDERDEYFQNELPYKFLDEFAATLADDCKYDRIVIDEGQDLMNLNAYLCINELVKGGWENGKWTIYYDPHQNLFVENNEFQEIWETLKKSSFIFPLTINCRNTRQIAEGNYAVTHVYRSINPRAEGEEVAYKTYKNKADERNQLFEMIRWLKSNGISKKDIVILSYYRLDNPESCLYNTDIPVDIGRIKFNVLSDFGKCKDLRYYTIQAFKGLEARAVIMIDVDSFSDEGKRYLNYVGMSRAKTFLTMFYESGLYQERQQRLLESLV